MKVLVACEYSGTVRDAFIARGHDAMSCDLLPTDVAGPHYQGDIFDIINDGWDILIAFPPCTHLCSSGARWWKDKKQEQEEAIDFVLRLYTCGIRKVAIENPVGILSRVWRKPNQIVQPWQFGHEETKSTCLWLKNLPKLEPTNIVGPPPKNMTKEEKKKWNKVHYASPGKDRWKIRSKTYSGIAAAMAEQWG